ncbi:phage tail terminator family protein [Aminipila terrae]|uniref:DUF3168 domain-containing protein n=1 Tax=Aminipila terrae TaxID=2697030 RepID=A0A6P1MLF6_9FIRM|nr:hypothetical protein [Aminipila terrae]QHI72898.1 hypothetical protein Ami3637_11210 [Aminipila terrae]
MVNSIKQAIADKLVELYPLSTVYDENVPQNFKMPSFLISLINQDYEKRINQKYKSCVSFNIDYFSGQSTAKINLDCLNVQLDLFRAFDLIGSYRVLNKQAKITDKVLHFTFDINYSEMIPETGIVMKSQTTNTKL